MQLMQSIENVHSLTLNIFLCFGWGISSPVFGNCLTVPVIGPTGLSKHKLLCMVRFFVVKLHTEDLLIW